MMKIRVFILMIVMLPFASNAQMDLQQFELTPRGFTEDISRIHANRTKTELYKDVKEWASFNIANSEDRKTKDYEGSFLEYHIAIPNAIAVQDGSKELYWNVLLELSVYFADNKIVYGVSILGIDNDEGEPFFFNSNSEDYSFFDLEGRPRTATKTAYKNINSLTNDLVNNITNSVNGVGELSAN